MAILFSEDDNVKTSFEIVLLKDNIKIQSRKQWLPYRIVFQSGDKKLEYSKSIKGTGDFVFGFHPVNELEKLTDSISNILQDDRVDKYSFEPFEPSFELNIEKSHEGYSVHVWVDAGNVISDHYTWDGFGLRIFTTQEKIYQFAQDLKCEMQELITERSVK